MRWPVLYADPPWEYKNWSDAKNGAAKSSYTTTSTRDMMEWPVKELAEPDALLFMWCTWPKLEEGLRVMGAWDFEYVTTPFVWVKTYADGSPYCGLGFWSRSATEFVLMGRRGKGITRQKSATKVMQVVEAPVGKPHSKKPEVIGEKISALVGELPALELFARKFDTKTGAIIKPGYHDHAHWTGTGLEWDGAEINDFITSNRSDGS
jgi:site-specific DNA-methyltransferase (adenine-specific)